MTQNSVYRWFADLILQRCQDDQAVAHQMEMSTLFGGFPLRRTFREDPGLARRAVDLIHAVAREVAAGQHVLLDDGGQPCACNEKAFQELFAELVRLLDRWRVQHPE